MNNEILMCPNYLQMMFSLEQVAQKDIKFMDVCCVLSPNIMSIAIFSEVWEDFAKTYSTWIFTENGLCFKSYAIAHPV